jgi:hypothetical protein
MAEPDMTAVIAADDAWTMVLEPEGTESVETAEYRLLRRPDRFRDPLQLQWLRPTRPVETVLSEVLRRAVEFGLPEMATYVKLSAADGLEEALLSRGARLAATSDVLALALPPDLDPPDQPGLEMRWCTTLEAIRDSDTIEIEAFGGNGPDDAPAQPREPADPSSPTWTAPRPPSRASKSSTAWPGCTAAPCWPATATAASTAPCSRCA